MPASLNIQRKKMLMKEQHIIRQTDHVIIVVSTTIEKLIQFLNQIS